MLVARLAADLFLWLVTSATFLALYVGVYALPSAAIVPHFRAVAVLWLTLAAVRMLAYILPNRRIVFWVSSAIMATGVTTLLCYYALVILGLNSWGRVITWDLIRTYAIQLPALLDALELSPLFISAFACSIFGLVLAAVLLHLSRFDWVPLLHLRVSRGVVALVGVASLAIGGIEVYAFTAAPWAKEREPLSLTLFANEASSGIQAHRIDRILAERLDQAEDAVRASYAPQPTAKRRNVILIVVDALRPDHLKFFGYPRNTTPNLVAIASKLASRTSRLVLRASCAESACGLLSLASSKYVHQFSFRPLTLSEVLNRNGYRVHLILGGDHTNFYGLREAYGKVDTYYDGSMARDRYMNDDRLILDRVALLPHWDGEPTMFQFHLMSTHALGSRQRDYEVFAPATNYSMRNYANSIGRRASESAVNYYDNGVLQADAVIGQLITDLTKKGYLSDAVVVITADHGELLGEHGLYTHAKSTYEEVLRVPFIMFTFGYRPEQAIGDQVQGSQVDVAPTILAELGMSKPATWVGVPLQSGHEVAITYFQEGHYAGLYDHRVPGHVRKYYVNTNTGLEKAVDLASNPTERDDITVVIPPALNREWRALVLPTVRNNLAD